MSYEELTEAIGWLAGEEHTDAPACACPVLSRYADALNTAMGESLQRDAIRARYLHDLAPLLIECSSTPEVQQARAFVLADRAVRVFAPLALDAASMRHDAAQLRGLAPITDERTARVAQAYAAEIGAGRPTGNYLRDAARDAAWVAAGAAEAAGDANVIAAAGVAGLWCAGDAAKAAGDAVWASARQALIAAIGVAL